MSCPFCAADTAVRSAVRGEPNPLFPSVRSTDRFRMVERFHYTERTGPCRWLEEAGKAARRVLDAELDLAEAFGESDGTSNDAVDHARTELVRLSRVLSDATATAPLAAN